MDNPVNPVNPVKPYPPGSAPFRDQSRALTGWGWVQIAAGAMCVLLSALFALVVLFSPGLKIPASSFGMNIALYLVTGASLVALGIGSIKARRWSRVLSLIVAWTWLATGVLIEAAMILFLPRAMASAGAPSGAMTCALAGMALGAAIFLVALPLLLALFYRRDDVRRTFEARDPVAGWTESLPPSLLAIVLVLALGGFFSVLSPLFVHAVPLFGTIWTGLPAAALAVVAGAVSLVLAAGVWRRSMAAWWGLLVLQVFGLVNGLMLRGLDTPTLLRASGYSDDQMNGAAGADFLRAPSFLIVLLGTFVATTVFLFAVRRHFRGPSSSRPNARASR